MTREQMIDEAVWRLLRPSRPFFHVMMSYPTYVVYGDAIRAEFRRICEE